MKRGCLFGFGASLILIAVGHLFCGKAIIIDGVAVARQVSVAVGLAALLAAGFSIWAAGSLPRSNSWLVATIGWILGSFGPIGLILLFAILAHLAHFNFHRIQF